MVHEQGASASPSGSRPPDQAQLHGPDASRFDPSRKPWPLCGYAPGNYMGRCVQCEQQFEGDKRALECLECAAMSAKGLIRVYETKARELREWRAERRVALDELIRGAAIFWGAGSEQHNLVRDVADALFREKLASGTVVGTATDSEAGVAEGKGPTGEAGDAQGTQP